MPVRRKAVLFPSLWRALAASKFLREEVPKSKGTKAERVCATVRCASEKESRTVWLQACYRGASALPLQRSRHSHRRARRDRSKCTIPRVAAKGNNSRIKPCRLQSATAAYAQNFRLQIEVVGMFTYSILNQFL